MTMGDERRGPDHSPEPLRSLFSSPPLTPGCRAGRHGREEVREPAFGKRHAPVGTAHGAIVLDGLADGPGDRARSRPAVGCRSGRRNGSREETWVWSPVRNASPASVRETFSLRPCRACPAHALLELYEVAAARRIAARRSQAVRGGDCAEIQHRDAVGLGDADAHARAAGDGPAIAGPADDGIDGPVQAGAQQNSGVPGV